MRLNPLDYLFLRMETAENPANVALLAIYKIPKNRSRKFVRTLRERFLKNAEVSPPFNLRLKPQGLVPGWYEWEEDCNFDLGFHVRHSALPAPGKMEDLMELVSRLHARLLDRSRPLWECYLIEGLAGGRFATYMKMHHSIVDGVGGVELLENGLTLKPDSNQVIAMWNPQRVHEAREKWPGLQRLLFSKSTSALKQALAIPQAAYAIFAPTFGLKKTAAGKPFRAGNSMFNKRITANRNFGVGTISLEEARAVSKSLGATVNDIFLSSCAGALFQYMKARGYPPAPDFSAGVPVAMKRERGSNAIAYIVVALHPEITDPLKRLAAISESASEAKHDQSHLSRTVINTMTLMAQGTQAALGQIGLAEILPPAVSLVISNVPGLNRTRYLMGARVLALYPMSVLMHAQGLNITVFSYAGELQYGILSTPEIAPDVQHLARLVGEEFINIRTLAEKRNKAKKTGGKPLKKTARKRATGKKKILKKSARKTL